MQRICVFCGSKVGSNGAYRDAAIEMGRVLAERRIPMVYGGGSVGLMGVLADTVLAAGGDVIGVIPQALATKELLHAGVRDMHVMPSMHARKARMAELSDAFVGMPGGFGTFEELLEMITWSQLGIHSKPVGLLNVAGYFGPLVQFIDHAIAEGFIKPSHRQLVVIAERPATLVDQLARHKMPTEHKWATAQES